MATVSSTATAPKDSHSRRTRRKAIHWFDPADPCRRSAQEMKGKRVEVVEEAPLLSPGQLQSQSRLPKPAKSPPRRSSRKPIPTDFYNGGLYDALEEGTRKERREKKNKEIDEVPREKHQLDEDTNAAIVDDDDHDSAMLVTPSSPPRSSQKPLEPQNVDSQAKPVVTNRVKTASAAASSKKPVKKAKSLTPARQDSLLSKAVELASSPTIGRNAKRHSSTPLLRENLDVVKPPDDDRGDETAPASSNMKKKLTPQQDIEFSASLAANSVSTVVPPSTDGAKKRRKKRRRRIIPASLRRKPPSNKQAGLMIGAETSAVPNEEAQKTPGHRTVKRVAGQSQSPAYNGDDVSLIGGALAKSIGGKGVSAKLPADCKNATAPNRPASEIQKLENDGSRYGEPAKSLSELSKKKLGRPKGSKNKKRTENASSDAGSKKRTKKPAVLSASNVDDKLEEDVSRFEVLPGCDSFEEEGSNNRTAPPAMKKKLGRPKGSKNKRKITKKEAAAVAPRATHREQTAKKGDGYMRACDSADIDEASTKKRRCRPKTTKEKHQSKKQKVQLQAKKPEKIKRLRQNIDGSFSMPFKDDISERIVGKADSNTSGMASCRNSKESANTESAKSIGEEQSVKKKVGRPKGSKNKPKHIESFEQPMTKKKMDGAKTSKRKRKFTDSSSSGKIRVSTSTVPETCEEKHIVTDVMESEPPSKKKRPVSSSSKSRRQIGSGMGMLEAERVVMKKKVKKGHASPLRPGTRRSEDDKKAATVFKKRNASKKPNRNSAVHTVKSSSTDNWESDNDSGGSRLREVNSISKTKTKRKRNTKYIDCGDCLGCCLTKNCGRCIPCMDMPELGGEGYLKNKCVLRNCLKPIIRSKILWTRKPKVGRDATEEAAPNIRRNSIQRRLPSVAPPSNDDILSLSDNASMIVDDMSDLDWDDAADDTLAGNRAAMIAYAKPPGHAASPSKLQSSPNTRGLNKEPGEAVASQSAADLVRRLRERDRSRHIDFDDEESDSENEDLIPPPPPVDF